MKILFSNGNIALASACDHARIKNAQGLDIDAVIISMTNINYDEFKALFNNATNLSEMTILNDENAEIARLSGYTESMGVNIIPDLTGNNADIFKITLGKATTIPDKIEGLTRDVSELTKRLEFISKTFEQHLEHKDRTNDLIVELNQTIEGFRDAVNTVNAGQEKSASEFTEYAKRINEIYELLPKIEEVYKSINEKLTDVYNSYTNIIDAVNETNRFSASAVSLNDAAKQVASEAVTEYQGMKSDIDRMNQALVKSENVVEKNKELLSSLEKTTENYGKSIGTLLTDTERMESDIKNVSERLSVFEPADITSMSLEDAKAYRISESCHALEDFLEANPISSSCHGGETKRYSVTKEKQSYLQAMILTTQMSLADGIEYTPSWNATGESCTYDWTLNELKQLAFEIEAYIRPLVSAQQKYENQINACTTMDELMEIQFDYQYIDQSYLYPPSSQKDMNTDSDDTVTNDNEELEDSNLTEEDGESTIGDATTEE